MTAQKVPHAIDAGNGAVHVHQHVHAPRPLSVADNEGALRTFGFPHRRQTYRAIGVPVTELPDRRFAVLVADVEAALRARGAAPEVAPPQERSNEDPALARAGFRIVGGGR